MSLKIRKHDQVIVLTGKDKGKKGKVIKILNNNKILVEGINIVKKHQKPIPSKNQKGCILKKELPINISNVAILNKITNKADRIGFKFENNKKIRFLKSNGEILQ
ncbi:50S ribosomal protein L24 [Buchnera aphidicola (Taiwanaphis decaspermi)]|uniref:50S ribosomal protein L24 n=1 Tax=Buchnera aphidicola TaxID=9 RepID=UPI0031B82CCE